MAPVHTEPIFFNGYPTPEDSIGNSDFADSPLEDGYSKSPSVEQQQNGQNYLNVKKRPSKSQSNKSKSSEQKNGSAFRFVVVDHPNQLRDRQEMRENRMHVMHDYLNKERRRPGSRDTRVNGSSKESRKPKSPEIPAPTKLNGALSMPTTNFRANVSRLTPTDSVGSDCSSDRDVVENSAKRPATASSSRSGSSGEPAALIRRVYRPPSDDTPLVSGIGGRWQYSAYMRTTPNDIPKGPGLKTEPFNAWPTLIDPSLDVNALKWSCTQRFGSDKLALNWIPALLRARHAFLSTLCISSSHDAIMSRALVPSHVQSSYRNIQRWKVKQDVIAMLGECMKDPKLQLADETMVSIVHLLVSDIMGCDDRDLKVHQDGLVQMATARGGLDKLGVGGELAVIITIMNYLIAALREMQPHADYVQYALQLHLHPTDQSDPLPESPVLSRPSGFHGIHRAIERGGDIHELLDTVRLLTNRFYVEAGEQHVTAVPEWPEGRLDYGSVASLCSRVFALQPARDKEFNDMNERYTYESIRLTSLVYAHALSRRISISKAAEELGKRNASPSAASSPGGRKSSEPKEADRCSSMAIQIKYALLRTDISYCWDHMGGVLFWVALIGGAAANPGAFSDEERAGEEEDARKFLAAIAVRCCVVLGFEYPQAIMETLKRVVLIETALAQSPQRSQSPEAAKITPRRSPVQNGWAPPTPQMTTFGPAQPTEVQKGFADYAQDFLNA